MFYMEDANLIKQLNESVPNVELEKETASGKKQTDNFITEIKPQKERIEWIVVLRAFACMAVVMIHVLGRYSSDYILRILLEPFIRFAIPVFIMISGCLFLDPKRDMPLVKLLKYIIKYLCLVILFGVFYFFIFRLEKLTGSTTHFNLSIIWYPLLKSFIDLTNFTVKYHLWFLIALIALLVLTPIFREFVKHANAKTIKFVLILLFITSSIIPTINNYFNLHFFEFSVLDRVLFIYLIGYFIVYTNIIKDKYIFICGLFGIMVWAIAFYFDVADQLDTFMVLEAMLIVKLFASKKIVIKNNKIINCISKYSLGIYLIHPFCIEVILKINTVMPLFNNEIIIFFCVSVLSLVSSMILYRMPLIKKLFK